MPSSLHSFSLDSKNLETEDLKAQLAKATNFYYKGQYYSALAEVDLLFQFSILSEDKYKDFLVDAFLLVAEVLYSLQQYELALKVFKKTPSEFLRPKINDCLSSISIQNKRKKIEPLSFLSLGLENFSIFLSRRSKVYDV